MDERDRGRFGDVVEGLALAFKAKVSKPLFSAYWLGLRDLPIEALELAAEKALKECKFMPVPRELRDLAGVLSAEQRAIVAWGAVKAAIKEHGAYRSVGFDDGAINAAVRSLGGWVRLCSTEGEELDKWTSKEFQRLYRELGALDLAPDLTRYLPGIFESSGEWTEKRAPARIATGTAVRPLAIEGDVDARIAQLADSAPAEQRRQLETAIEGWLTKRSGG